MLKLAALSQIQLVDTQVAIIKEEIQLYTIVFRV